MKIEKTSKRLLPLLPYFLTALIAFAIYAKTINYGITNLDDKLLIHTCAQNYNSPAAFTDAFEHDIFWGMQSVLYYRPMLAISFILDHKIAGESESFAHLTNVLLHAFSSVIILFFFRRYLCINKTLSFLAAVLFAVHPIAVQTAAWIPGRNDSLFFIYFAACLICFIEYMRSKKTAFLLTHIIFLLFCLFTKESAAAVPFILFLYHITHKNKDGGSLKFYVYFIWALCLTVFLFARASILANTDYRLQFEFGNRLNIAAFFDHISAFFFLRSPMAEHKDIKVFVLGTASVLISLFTAFYKKDKNGAKKILFYLLTPLIILLPDFISGDYKISRFIFHGNRMYVPMLGYLAIIFLFFNNFTKTPKCRKILYAALIAIIMLSSAITLKNTFYLKDSLTFWDRVISENKESSVYAISPFINNLLDNNRFDKAFAYAAHYAKESNYENPEFLYLLGKVYLFKEDYESASKYLDIAYSKTNKKTLDLYSLNYFASIRANNKKRTEFYYNFLLRLMNLTPEESDGQFIIYSKNFDDALKEIKLKKSDSNLQ